MLISVPDLIAAGAEIGSQKQKSAWGIGGELFRIADLEPASDRKTVYDY
jgi:hypothetical protein